MKKIFLFILLCLFMIPISVKADHMYNVQMDIDILNDGSANITEVWDVEADSGSEWYKQLYNMGESELSNFVVYMDGEKLKNKIWDVDESLSEKAGYYGINYVSDGIELCFGKSDMDRHTFTLTYTLSNVIFNTNDSQVFYWTLFPKLTADDFSVKVSSYYQFPDTLEVWGYGNKGYSYVENGRIVMSNEGSINDEYVVLLVKFPLNTFNTSLIYEDYSSFDVVLEHANTGAYKYDYGDNSSFIYEIIGSFAFLFLFALPILIIVLKYKYEIQYGYVGNKKINKKEIAMFRDIPCDKDIYYANVLMSVNDFGYKKSYILGAMILKLVKDKRIIFKNVDNNGLFNKNTSVIEFISKSEFENDLEQRLYKMMKKASKDGILEVKEFEKWCRKNYSEFLKFINSIYSSTIIDLRKKKYIYIRENKKECKYRNVMNDKMYNDSVKLYGLKKYLEEFSKIDTKEVMEVHLWDEYLMFAYLFGIADKVAKQLKDMYPEIVEQVTENGNIMMLDYDMIRFIGNISTRSVSAASSARASAESYSAGGGGFSSGGGGMGSFGGGGSMGGR